MCNVCESQVVPCTCAIFNLLNCCRINIRKITFKRRRFFIELRPDQETGEQNAVGFHMDSYDGCKQLWKDCIDYHAFFRLAPTVYM